MGRSHTSNFCRNGTRWLKCTSNIILEGRLEGRLGDKLEVKLEGRLVDNIRDMGITLATVLMVTIMEQE